MPGASQLAIAVLITGFLFLCGQILWWLCDRRKGLANLRSNRPVLAGDAPEERAAAALRHSPVAVLVTNAAASVPPVAGFVIDRSTEGVIVELEDDGQVDPGTQLKVRPTGADSLVPWVLVEVARRQGQKSCWQLDCRYVRTPPYSVRMLFG